MNFAENNWYHVYNRGNNKRAIFFEERNYLLFLEKTRKHLSPCCDIISYCLMPNHFHFLIAADKRTTLLAPNQKIPLNAFSDGMRHLLSSYTKAINNQEGFTGNLFQQKTQSKCVLDLSMMKCEHHYDDVCFHYIHQNPAKAKLVEKMEDWRFSSFRDYAGLRNGTLCNVQRGLAHFDYDRQTFLDAPYQIIKEDAVKHIF